MWLFGIGVALQMAGGLASLVLHSAPHVRSRLAAGSVILGSLCALASAIGVLASGEAVSIHGAWAVPLGSFSLGLDALSAVFVLPIAIVSAGTAVYGCEYLDRSSKTHASPTTWFFFNFLAATMLLVVAARNGVLFLVCWEGMSLASFFLVLTERDEELGAEIRLDLSCRHAPGHGLSAGTVSVVESRPASLDFDRLRARARLLVGMSVSPGRGRIRHEGRFRTAARLASRSASRRASHVSALMSGVMIKTGIYGLLRTIEDSTLPPAWCGWMLVAVGVVVGVLGVLFAIAQHDLKRLLAYSSVENIGIIVLGIGVGLLGVAYRIPAMTALGLIGSFISRLQSRVVQDAAVLGAGQFSREPAHGIWNGWAGLLKRQPVTGMRHFLIGACGDRRSATAEWLSERTIDCAGRTDGA